MSHDVTVDVKILNGVPVFAMLPGVAEQERVFGYTIHKATRLCLFPAILPFADYVEEDLRLVYDENLRWTERAQEHLEHLAGMRKSVEMQRLPEAFEYHTKPFAHQHEAVVHCYWHHRKALFYDCGLGKTKCICDSLMALRTTDEGVKALILCPPRIVRNWQRELQKHTGGALRALPFIDANNSILPAALRRDIYTYTDGVRGKHPYTDAFPLIVYDAVPVRSPAEVREAEFAYLQAVHADDKSGRTSTRKTLRDLCKKHGVPAPGTARVVPPTPNPRDYDAFVLSYDALTADVEDIIAYLPFNTIVADESHNLQSPFSARTKAALKASAKAGRRYLMSGTPSLGDPKHLYGQLAFLAPYTVPPYYKYMKRHYIYSPYNDKIVIGNKNLHVLSEIAKDLVLRKKKDECLDLPEQTFVTHYVDVGDETRRRYNELVGAYSVELADGRVLELEGAQRLDKLFQILSGFVMYTEEETGERKIEHLKEACKLDALEDLLDEVLVEKDNKVVIWCHYTEEIKMVEARLAQLKIGYVRVDGRTKNATALQDKFNTDEACRVYLSQESMGEGFELIAANYTIWYGTTYMLKNWEQANDRNNRIGQTRRNFVFRLVVAGSVHDYVYKSLDNKDISARTMTDVIRCGTCQLAEVCRENGTKPFDLGCVYNTKTDRVTTRPALL